MANKVDVRLQPPGDADAELCFEIVLNDASVRGKEAELRIELVAHVKRNSPIHARKLLCRQVFTLDSPRIQLQVPRAALNDCYAANGKQLDLRLVTRLEIDDGILFDTEVEHHHAFPLGDRPRTANGDPALMDPKDAFSFMANLAALPYRNRMIVLGLSVIGGLLALGNLVLGVHDQSVGNAQVWFYDQIGADGSESPLLKALIGSGGVGVALWAAIMYQLRKYMRFDLRRHEPIGRGTRLRLSDLVEGESRVPLRDITVRVVACNRECGQYTSGSGTKKRTVSFKTPVRAVKLFEKQVALVPPKVPVAMYLDGEVDFEPMFADLMPPLMVSNTHGIDVAWEVQLLHPQYVDHELEGDTSGLRYRDFLDD